MMRLVKGLIALALFWGLSSGAPALIEVPGNAPDRIAAASILPDCHCPLRRIAFDPDGNLYGVGGVFDYNNQSASEDILVVKHDADGYALWEARYNNPDHLYDYDYGTGIAVDSDGNVFVTGSSPGSVTGYDFVTLKFDTNGNRLWERRYDGPAHGADYVSGLAIDSSGNVYVAGSCVLNFNNGTNYDYATLKHDTYGNLKWEQRYNAYWDYCAGIAVDSIGNAYVTGRSYAGGYKDYDFTTIKYNPDGTGLWVRRYDSPGQIGDEPADIAVDSSGYVYVTGRSGGIGPGQGDFITVKYDTNGNELWPAIYDGPGNGTDWSLAIALDEAGNSYVTGMSQRAPSSYDFDFATVKYDADGKQLWARTYDSGIAGYTDQARTVVVDAAGGVYVAGTSYSQKYPAYDAFFILVKYDSGGQELWSNRIAAPQGFGPSSPYLIIDPSGNLCMLANTRGTIGRDVYCISWYAADGTLLRTATPEGVFFNERPTANAGPDLDITDTDLSGSESVSLDGTGSSDSDGSIVSYVWRKSGTEIATGSNPTISFAIGTYQIQLTVQDNGAPPWIESDDVMITVHQGNAPSAINALMDVVQSIYYLEQGVTNSLNTKLRIAQDALADAKADRSTAAIKMLESFKKECEALSGRALSTAQADLLVQKVNYIIDFLQQQES